MFANSISADRIIVALNGDEIVGIAGLKYDGTGFFSPDRLGFIKRYGHLVGRVRAALWVSVQTIPRPHQLLLDGLGLKADMQCQGKIHSPDI